MDPLTMSLLIGGISAGGSALGGLFNSNAISQTNQLSAADFNIQNINQKAQFAQGQADWQASFDNAVQQQQLAQQQQAFNNQITMGGNIGSVMSNLVDSAKAVGLSPQAVLGMSTPGVSVVPGVAAGGSGPSGGVAPTPDFKPNTGIGNAMASMGQDVSRAIEGFYNATSRSATLDAELKRAQVTNLDAQSNSLTVDAARKLGGPGTPKPAKNLNEAVFGKEPQWPTGIPGDLAQGLLRGFDWIGRKLDPNDSALPIGQWPGWLRDMSPDPSVYNTP